MRSNQSKDRGAVPKLAALWLVMVLLGSFWLTVKGTGDSVSIAVVPQVPREGEPILAIFKLFNPSSTAAVIRYQFYANGRLLKEGSTTVNPHSAKTYKYAYESPVRMGEQINFAVRAQSALGDHEKILSSPPYPPQVWSSFVSFASFSTSVMGAMASMTYYESTFGNDKELNAGLIISVVLLALLIFGEMTRPALASRTVVLLAALHLKFSTVTWILLVIFLGFIYTRVIMVLSG